MSEPRPLLRIAEGDAARLARLGAGYATRVEEQDAAYPGYGAAWDRFVRTVLAHGGAHVVPPLQIDPLIDLLAEHGHIHDGRELQLYLGATSACHTNVVALWRTGDAAALGTGYALSDDFLWRQHSWAWDADGHIIETTEPRLRYFGVRMDDDFARWFADWVDPPSH